LTRAAKPALWPPTRFPRLETFMNDAQPGADVTPRAAVGPHGLGWTGVLMIAALALATALAASHWVSTRIWAADVINLFRPALLAGDLGLLILGVALRRPRLQLWAAVLVGAELFILWGAGGRRLQAAAGPVFTIATANVMIDNPDPARTVRWLEATRPDIVALVETPQTPAWTAAYAALRDVYPYQAGYVRPHTLVGDSDVRLFSRWPLDKVFRRFMYDWEGAHVFGRWAVGASVQTPRGPMLVVASHPSTLTKAGWWARRNRMLATLAAIIRNRAEPSALLLGDLNTPPWSPYYATLLATAGLGDAERRMAPPNSRILARLGPFSPGSPIDHVLASPDLRSGGCALGPELGSDHRPVVCRLSLR
jgi:endonuclease/exonuclease/phosphatase (EEP) superfamily protein YafD